MTTGLSGLERLTLTAAGLDTRTDGAVSGPAA